MDKGFDNLVVAFDDHEMKELEGFFAGGVGRRSGDRWLRARLLAPPPMCAREAKREEREGGREGGGAVEEGVVVVLVLLVVVVEEAERAGEGSKRAL